jgi:hypothetical protein
MVGSGERPESGKSDILIVLEVVHIKMQAMAVEALEQQPQYPPSCLRERLEATARQI